METTAECLAGSINGKDWNLLQQIFDNGCNDIVWNGRMWAAAGLPVCTFSPISYSYDGLHWRSVEETNSILVQGGQAINWNGDLWMAGGIQGMMSSRNGQLWNPINNNCYELNLCNRR